MNDRWLSRAIEIASVNVCSGGGPFGAVITRDDQLIAEGVNLVTSTNDPTAHAEVTAVRNACRRLNSFDLSGCVIHTSCEPCPMCLGAIYWARLDAVWFAASRYDAAAAGFSDDMIYRALGADPMPERITVCQQTHPDYLRPFQEWASKEDKIPY